LTRQELRDAENGTDDAYDSDYSGDERHASPPISSATAAIAVTAATAGAGADAITNTRQSADSHAADSDDEAAALMRLITV
jgi:hypothetical protein